MLEQLRMQEVSQIILSIADGAEIPNSGYKSGDAIMVIDKPGLSNLSFITSKVVSEDCKGFIGESGMTNSMDFIINDGSVLYGLWSYLYGTNYSGPQTVSIKGDETSSMIEGNYIPLLCAPLDKINLYKINDSSYEKINEEDYELCVSNNKYYISYPQGTVGENYFIVYNYSVSASKITKIKQEHNNIFCSIDIYINAVDLKTDDKRTIYIHCDKVQVFTDMVLSVNNSQKISFTPIRIKSIPSGLDKVKDVATIMVI